MKNIGIIRCEKNEAKCPLTSCLKSLEASNQGFAPHRDEGCKLIGVFTCRCPGDNISDLAGILKAKGAEAIHFVTCAFSRKTPDGWILGDGFCPDLDRLVRQAADKTGLPCVKGSAHLPKNYEPEAF